MAREPIERVEQFGTRSQSGSESCDELFRPHPVARPARGHADSPFHGLGEGVGIGESDVIGNSIERIRRFTEKGIAAQEACTGDELARRDQPGAFEVSVERAAGNTSGGREIWHATEYRGITDQALKSCRDACGDAAQRPVEMAQKPLGEDDPRLALQHLPQVLGVVVEAEQNELLHPFAAKFDQRAQGLGGEVGIDDHGKRAVPVANGTNPVRARFRRGVELGVNDQDVHRLAADDRVSVSPVERHMHAMPVSCRPLEAGELGRLDACGDVH